MWTIFEASSVAKIVGRLPGNVVEKYEIWKAIVRVDGPAGLRTIKGFHDESLEGSWRGFRSSRLNRQYRVIYRVVSMEVRVFVERISAHDYRR